MVNQKTVNEETLDILFKQSLSNKVFLALIMKECIDEYKNEDLNTIIQQYIENHIEVGEKIIHPRIAGADKEKTDDNKQTTYDINFYARLPKKKDKIGIIINVEAQTKYKPGYHMMNRAHYYNARNISSQFNVFFTEDNYDGLRKVVSIWLILKPPVIMQDAINTYKMSEYQLIGNVHEKEELYNKNVMIMVYLSKEKSMNEMIQIFNDLRDRKLNMNQFKMHLKEEYDYELDDKTESEVNQMCNFSQYVKEEGKIETLLDVIQNLVKNTNVDKITAMKSMGIKEEENRQSRPSIKLASQDLF